MKETKEKLTAEEKRLLHKIRAIKNSEEVEEFVDSMIAYAENYGIPKVLFRIKEEQSALNKFREKGYTDAAQMGDLLGMMFITESTSQIYEFVEYMRSAIPHNQEKEEEDFIKEPKKGYRSFHLNAKKADFDDIPGVEVPIEMQIKTKPMQIAQKSIHATVYKQDTLPKAVRDQLSEILFPLVERMAQINGAMDKDEIKEKSELKQEINTILRENIQVLSQHIDIVNAVNKRYKTVMEKENNLQQELILDELGSVQENIDKVVEFHDQKSSQFFEDIKSGKYTVPPDISIKSSLEQDDYSGSVPDINNSLVEYKPSRLKAFFANIADKVKSSTLYNLLVNTVKGEQVEDENIDKATEKMETMKKTFDSYVVVSEEEQRRNRIEYEKSASISISRSKEDENEKEHD